jgi:hypothetical protein
MLTLLRGARYGEGVSSDTPTDRPVPSLEGENLGDRAGAATMVQSPSGEALASLKSDPPRDGSTLALGADDIFTESRARTDVVPRDLLPPMDRARDHDRAETAILVTAGPTRPSLEGPALDAPVMPSQAPGGVVPRPEEPPPSGGATEPGAPSVLAGNLPFLVVALVLFAIAAAIVASALARG